MKTTKNLFIAIAITTLLGSTFNSCKKGEGDPFLSLKSRKARVAGEWAIDNWKEESSFNSISNYNGETTTSSGNSKIEINGTNITISESGTYTDPFNSSSYNSNGSGSGNSYITFEKDGTFTRKMEFKNVNSTYISGSITFSSTYSQTIEEYGTWNFLGGVEEDYKNKERIILNIIEVKSNYNYSDSDGSSSNGNETESYANGENSEVWHMTTLKNKEMVLKAETANSGSHSATQNWGGTSYISSSSSSESGIIEGILIQK